MAQTLAGSQQSFPIWGHVKRPIHHLQLVRAEQGWWGVCGIPSALALCALHAQSPLKAEFMTFLSTASLMQKPKYQRLDSDTRVLGCLLFRGPCRVALTVSVGYYNLKPRRLGGGSLTEQLAYFTPSPPLTVKRKVPCVRSQERQYKHIWAI